MSFVTRCPACATHFRVVADQLKIADGWVRCGQCGEVFDAAAQLLAPAHGSGQTVPLPATRSDAAELAPPQPTPEVDEPQNPVHALDAGPAPWSDDGDMAQPQPQPVQPPWLEDPSALPPEPPPEQLPGPSPEPPPERPFGSAPSDPVSALEPPWVSEPSPALDPATDPVLSAAASDPAHATWPTDEPDPADRYEVPPASDLLPPPASDGPADADPALADASDLAAVPEQVGFVRQAQRRAWWRRPAVRWALGGISLLLLLALCAQWVLHERDRIAALRPDLRPALERLCAPLGCTVQPLRWVDALSIESTTLARRGNGRYLLEVVLRNASLYALAMPALELSLTDVQDKLLLRRVIRPDEMPAAPATVAAQETLTLRIEVQLEPAVSDGLSGYRTLLFYP